MDASQRPAASAPAAASPWILDPRRDLAFFVATPLLIVPLIALLQTRLTIGQIALYVAAFGATGHHLPGLLRAYGDRELFERFKLRFVLAPGLLTLCCVGLANTDLEALGVIVLIWGTWHGLAQVFGLVRIYDAKAKSSAPITVALDRYLLVAWFGGGLLYSPGRMAALLETFYAGGVPLLPGSGISAFTSLWGLATAALTVAWAIHHGRLWRAGTPASPLKLPTLVTSIGFWWYAMVWIDSAILGIALFELFHDVQYLAITWVFSRNRVDKGHRMGEFSRFLFRPSGLMIALYVTMALLYGYAIHMPGLIDAPVVRDSLLGLVATSALLHFYYDGFIWKVRERTTREGLGLSGGGSTATSWLHQGAGHALLWLVFVVPMAALIGSQLSGLAPEIEQRRSIAATIPSGYTQAKLGLALLEANRLDEAIAAFRAAVALEPDSAPGHHKLGTALQQKSDFRGAIEHHQIALELSGGRAERHDALGQSFAAAGRNPEAIEQFRAVVSLDPENRQARDRLAKALASDGRTAESIEVLEAIAADRSESWEAAYNLALSLSSLRRNDEAASQFERALALNPDAWQVHRGLGLVYRQLGRRAESREHLQRAAVLRQNARGT